MPLPHRGDLELGKAGEYQSYTLRPGGEALRDALLKVLVEKLGAERLPDEPGGYLRRRASRRSRAEAAGHRHQHYVALSMDNGDPEFMTRVA